VLYINIKLGKDALGDNLENNIVLKNDIAERFVMGLIAAALAISAILFYPPIFYVGATLIWLGLLWEFFQLTRLVDTLDFLKKFLLQFLGLAYITAGVAAFLLLDRLEILMALVLIWANDTFAFFVGRVIGGPKLCTQISPNKTWSGVLGGIAGGVVTSGILVNYLQVPFMFTYFYAEVVLLGIACHCGDLLESAFKRYVGVKDSGSIMPGHGGFLDRMDSLLMVGIIIGAWHVIKSWGLF
jgi:phosphatidate cytidylyltransferase